MLINFPQPNGIVENLGMGQLSSFEQEQLGKVGNFFPTYWVHFAFPQALPELLKNIKKGEEFAQSS